MYKIETAPSPGKPRAARIAEIPFAELTPGSDKSVVFECREDEVLNARSQIFLAAKIAGYKIATRTDPRGVRVWVVDNLKRNER